MTNFVRGKSFFILLGVTLLISFSTAVGGAQPVPTDPYYQPVDLPGSGKTELSALPYGSRSFEITHEGIDGRVTIRDEYTNPDPGYRRFAFIIEVVNIQVTADGVPLTYKSWSIPAEQYIGVVIPAGTSKFVISYDRLDGAFSHDDAWHYYGNDLLWVVQSGWIWGPTTVTIKLPKNASIKRVRNYGQTTIVDSHTVRFQPPDGKAQFLWVIYDAPEIPTTYETTLTPNFKVDIPVAHKPYRETLFSLLENAYGLMSDYSEHDLNELASQSHYYFSFSPWPFCYAGGLTVRGGPSSVLASYVTFAAVPASYQFNPIIGLTFHELGNGWWLLFYPDYWTDPTLPWWISNEGHSGFLRSQVTLDLGYCAQARWEQENHYKDYLACKAKLPGGIPCNGLVETMLISLQARYGWKPFRAIYAGVQDGTLDFSGLSNAQKDSAMIRFLSLQVGQNLIPFYEDHGIYADADTKKELDKLPTANVPIIENLSCRPDKIHYTPQRLSFTESGTQTLYIGSPHDWTYFVQPKGSWFYALRKGYHPFATLEVTADLENLPAGVNSAVITIASESSVVNSPVKIPITFNTETGIEGTVTDEESGLPIPGVLITAARSHGPGGGWSWADSAQTDDAGHYQLTGLVPGTFRISFTHHTYVEEYFNNKADSDSADHIVVELGLLTKNIDAALKHTGAGSISGTVTGGADAAPLAGIGVEALRYNSTDQEWQNAWSTGGFTDDKGQFEVPGLDPGDYRIYFDVDPFGKYAPEYFDDTVFLTEATDVTVLAKKETPNIDALLSEPLQPDNDDFDHPLEIWGGPYHNAQVTMAATSAQDDPEFPCAYSTDAETVWYRYQPEVDGPVTISSKGSTYLAFLAVWQGSRGSLANVACNNDAYNKRMKFSQIEDVMLQAGNTYFIEAAGSGGAAILVLSLDTAPGKISGTATAEAGGAVLHGISVEVYHFNRATKTWDLAGSATTDKEGRYSVDSLFPGLYRVKFYDKSRFYTAEFYKGSPDIDGAGDVAVLAGETKDEINAALVKGQGFLIYTPVVAKPTD